MPYFLQIEIPELPTVILNARQHWRVKNQEAQKWDRTIHFYTVGKRPPQPLQRAILTLTRGSARPLDFDNLASSWKHVVDSLVTCGIIADDSYQVIGMPRLCWEKAPNKQGFIRIWVQSVDT